MLAPLLSASRFRGGSGCFFYSRRQLLANAAIASRMEE